MSRSSVRSKVVVVTGAGRGIGESIAREFHRQGARVALADLDAAEVTRAAASLGPDARGYRVDVTDRRGFATFLDQVQRDLGPVDVLVNNAGIMPVGSFLEEDPDLADKQIQVNLTAVVHGSREAAQRMVPRGGGHIVNVASIAGRLSFVGVSTYCATKFGVYGLSEALRRELKGTGVSVSCVMPGVVNTQLCAGMDRHPLLPAVEPEVVARRVVDAVERRRFAVYVPSTLPLYVTASAVLPGRAMDAVLRVIGGDRLMLSAAHTPDRQAYDDRVRAE